MDTGCSLVLVIVSSFTMNIGVHVSFQIRVLSGYMPRNGIAGSYGNSIFSFWGTSILFSIVAALIYIPTNSVGGFPFSILSPGFIICRLFEESHSDWYEVIPLCSFNLLFSNSNIEHLFMCLLAICTSSLEKCLFRSAANYFLYWAALSVCMFWKLSPCRLYHLQIFSPRNCLFVIFF